MHRDERALTVDIGGFQAFPMKMLKRYGMYVVVAAWATACFLFFHLAYRYHFFFQEQNQIFLLSGEYVAAYLPQAGWASRLIGDFLTQFYYYLLAGPAIITAALLVVGNVTRRLLQQWGLRSQWWATLAALVPMTVLAVFSLHHDYKLSNIIAAGALVITLWLATLAFRHLRALRIPTALTILCVGIWMGGWPNMGKLQRPNFYLERQLAADNEYHLGNYNRLFQLVESDPEPTQEMKFFYNMARASRQELPDYLLRFADNDLGTFHRIGPETPRLVINNMNELYWMLGDMTFCERAAMMSNVFSRDNRNVRMIKRLAECNLVSGDSLAAQKYLRILKQTLVYSDWAERIMNHEPKTWRYIVEKQNFVNKADTVRLTDNLHMVMMELLDSNADNVVALDYILCSDLLLKDIEHFKRDYDRYCTDRPRVKKLYQEALCIWLAGTHAPQEQWQQLITMPDVARRFAQYNSQRGNKQFSDTYWYYFDTARAPKVE